MRIVGNNPQLSRQTQATASGAITGGTPVVVNTDGTVTGVGNIEGFSAGTAVNFEAAQVGQGGLPQGVFSAFDSSNNKVVIAYRDFGNSNYGTAIVGTVSGTAISFGTPVVFESAETNYPSIAFDSNANKMVIAFQDAGNSNYGKAIVGTVSGTGISFGSVATFESATTSYISTTFDSNSNKAVIAYQDNGNSNYGTAVVATVSGTSISFGTPAVFESAQTVYIGTTFDSSNNKVVIAYRDVGNSNHGTAIVGTVSSTSISFGSAAVFNSAQTDYASCVFDSNSNKVVIVYNDRGNDNDAGYGANAAIVGTVSSTSISFGTQTIFSHGAFLESAFDSSINKVVVAYRDSDESNHGYVILGTVSGTGISFGTSFEFENNVISHITAVFDSNSNNTVVAYQEDSTLGHGYAIVISSASENLTSENFIGFAQDTVATGQPVTVNTKGAIADNIPQIPSASSSLGTAVSFESATTSRIASCFDSTNNRIVVSYVDSGSDDDGTVAVGTVSASDNSISWGTPVHFNSNVKITDSQIIHDSNSNKIVVAYTDEDNSFYGTGIVGTIDTSDNSISFGSPTVYESANTNTSSRNGITFDSNSNKVVIVYTDQGNSNYGTAVVGTVSGTSISFGTPVVFESAFSIHMGATFDTSNNKVVIAYRDVGNSDYGTAIVGTVSGTSISFGTAVVYESAESDWNSITFDSNSNKVVISYQDKGNSNYGTAIVGTVSGTSISFGTAVVYESASVNYTAIDFDSNLNKVIIGYEDIGNSEYGTFVIGTVSGTSISFTSPAVFYSGELSWVGVSFDSNAKRSVFTYRDANNSNNGRSVVMQPAGILEDIVPAQTYYVQTDGTLSQTADDPSVTAGTAVAGSTLIVKG